MLRLAELAVFFVPLAAVLLWWAAIARGLNGPPPRLLVVILAGLLALGGVLFYLSLTDALPPGRYVPAQLEDGRIVTGHSQ